MKKLSATETKTLLETLKTRFDKNPKRHKDIDWKMVEAKILKSANKLWSLSEMERTGGEPDVVGIDAKTKEFIFMDCSAESPKERRSLCYDEKALEDRKEFKPADSAMHLAKHMGVEMLDEEQYRALQKLGKFDTKTSSWLKTPEDIRKLGGAIFGDYRYATVFVYHNGASSYYASRGFRAALRV